MEKIVTIVAVGAYAERQYQNGRRLRQQES